jgi:hypothetical protein
MDGVTVSWQLADQQTTLYEPIPAELSVENRTGAPITLNLGTNETGGVLFTIVRPDHSEYNAPPIEPSGFSRRGVIQVEPGLRYVHEFVVDQWYSFNSVGE